jgi:hypothetical protein
MKSWWGAAATAENDWAYDYLPKLDKPVRHAAAFELMNQGKMNGYLCQGFNPARCGAEPGQAQRALSKLKFLVIMDPLRPRRAILEELRRAQRRRPGEDPDRGVPPADDLLRRGRRFADQFRALAAMALEGAEPPGEAQDRPGSWPLFTAPARGSTARTAAPSPIRSST